MRKKSAYYRPFKNGQFVRVCTEKMIDHLYRENGARNIYSNYIQMKTYFECYPSQSKKIYLIDISSSNRRNFGYFGKILTGLVCEFCQGTLI